VSCSPLAFAFDGEAACAMWPKRISSDMADASPAHRTIHRQSNAMAGVAFPTHCSLLEA